VRKINVRSTEIETFDRASLFLPNSTLIMGAVKNWMHRDLSGRSQIDLIVPHGTDPELVKATLLKCAADHPLVVVFPAPGAFLIGFETIGMKFRLSCTVGHVNDAFSVESDLRFAALKKLKEKNIALADGGQPLKTEELAAIVDRLLDLRIPKTPALQPSTPQHPAPQHPEPKDTTP
jgi:small-conductance mechanosensitive channel